jgi:hypothetical protein
VLAPLLVEDRLVLVTLRGRHHLAAGTDQKQFVLVAIPVTGAGEVGVPDLAGDPAGLDEAGLKPSSAERHLGRATAGLCPPQAAWVRRQRGDKEPNYNFS